MISRVILSNYRSYESLDRTFKDDLNVIQGRNATGKSTIVEAIGYALQGSSLQKGTATSWIKTGCSDGLVTLYIDDFIIARGNKKQLVKDIEGNILARGHTGINEWVLGQYGLMPELYKTSFHIAQKEIASFAALGPMEKTKRVEKLLKLDVIDKIKIAALSDRKTLVTAVSRLESKLVDVKSYTEEDLKDYQEQLEKSNEDLSLLRGKELAQAQLVIKYEKELDLWNKKISLRQRLIDPKAILETVEDRIATTEAGIKSNEALEQNLALYRKKQQLENKIANLDINKEYFTIRIEDAMDLKNSLVKSDNAKKILTEDYSTFDYSKIDFDLTKEDILGLEKDLYSHTQNLADLEALPSCCPTCKQDMPDMSKEILILGKKVAKKRKDLEAKKTILAVSSLNNQLYKGKHTLKVVESMLVSIVNKETYLSLQEMTEVTEPEKSTVSTSFLKSQLVDLKFDLGMLGRLDEYSDVTQPEKVAFIDYKRSIRVLSGKIESLRVDVSTIENSLAVLAEYKKDLDATLEEKETLDAFIKFIGEYRAAFSAKIIPMLEENANKIINYLSDGKLKKLNLDSSYIIQGYDLYSGSEEDAANFALRLAIAQISRIGSYNTIILDEIAASYDSVREDRLLEVLKATEMQIIYISHGDINY